MRLSECVIGSSQENFSISTTIPNVAKVGRLQSQGVKVKIVVGYIDPLTTQDLKSSGFPVR
jgi:hypothetical protein